MFVQDSFRFTHAWCWVASGIYRLFCLVFRGGPGTSALHPRSVTVRADARYVFPDWSPNDLFSVEVSSAGIIVAETIRQSAIDYSPPAADLSLKPPKIALR